MRGRLPFGCLLYTSLRMYIAGLSVDETLSPSGLNISYLPVIALNITVLRALLCIAQYLDALTVAEIISSNGFNISSLKQIT